MGRKTEANRGKISHLRSSHRSKTKLRVKSTMLAILPPSGYQSTASLTRNSEKKVAKLVRNQQNFNFYFTFLCSR